jgi:hypothetical protein
VLGSDLLETPGKGWTAITDADPDMHRHHHWKVPHHGSSNALASTMLPRTASPAIHVVTPFATSGLPKFGAAQGIARLALAVRHGVG